jgi:tetratricopeptide (TPR) repeat protein
MQIKRDYSQPFFSNKPRRRLTGRWAFIFGLVIGLTVLFVGTQFDAIRMTALDLIGMAPTPTPFPGELATNAMNAYLSGDTDTAVAFFERAVSERPEDIDYLYEYGQILIELTDYERAIDFGDQAIELNLFDPRGYALKAKGLVFSGDSAAAIPVALSGINVDDQFAPLYAVLARAYVDTGNLSAGIENGARAVAMDPMSADARRSYAYALSATTAYDEAIIQLQQGAIANPRNVEILFELAYQFVARDLDEAALEIYDEILVLQPSNARALLRMCETNRKLGRFDTGATYCQEAVNADPTYSPAQLQLGLIKYTARDFIGAQNAFQACVDHEADNLACYYRLGLTHYYLALQQREAEFAALDVQSVIPTAAAAAGGDGTAAPNAMLEEAMEAAANLASPTPAFTTVPTNTPPPTAVQISSGEHCDRAWTILQESMTRAQVTQASEQTISDIRLGLSLVARDCPAYFGAAPTPYFEPTAAVTETSTPAVVIPAQTVEIMETP